ncbi:MAG: phospholipase D-like domain-containing protein, partial [Prochlorococcus sp.]
MKWILLIILGCTSCSKVGTVSGSTPGELPVPDGIHVVFNHSDLTRYRSPLTDQWRNGDNLEEFIVNAINEAQQEILVAVQELSLPGIAEALVAAKQRGVSIKMVMENTYSQPWGDLHEADLSLDRRRQLTQLKKLADRNGDNTLSVEELRRGDAVAILRRHQIPLIDDTEDGSKGSGLMHHKFLVIDGHIVITGSANFSSSGIHGDAGARKTRGNVNHLLRFDSTELAELFKKEFLLMWGDGFGGAKDSRFGLAKNSSGIQVVRVGNTRIEVLFSPHDKHQKLNG